VSAEVDGYERQPDDARRIHGEPNVLRFVEILRNLPRLDRIHGAHDDQQHVVDERQQKPLILHATFQHHLDNRDRLMKLDICCSQTHRFTEKLD